MPKISVDLSGQNALVTGAGAGIGRAIALALAESGAAVALNDLNIERAEAVAADIQERGARALPLHGDVANRFQTANMIEQTRDAFGKIHILVNAAGAFKAEPMLAIDEWDWRRQIEVNVTGNFFCTQLVGRVMADEGGGRIVNLAAAVGIGGSMPSGIAYVAGKASVLGMTRQAARELAPYNILVNAIAAGNIAEDDMPPVPAESVILNRGGLPRDIAGVALFLCSDAAAYMTGQVLVVDGGGTAFNS
ncbi:MAG: SDR family oxidoreductase [Chloroflexi bacterium]|nr:SDR family oxidoreductase [Chloroflexota bacterium]